ncbi:hypothetical protein GUT184_13150 [Streptococcus ruminantium]|nr:hypothetical protein GUT184_13150 [Streptococcus ruminantium]
MVFIEVLYRTSNHLKFTGVSLKGLALAFAIWTGLDFAVFYHFFQACFFAGRNLWKGVRRHGRDDYHPDIGEVFTAIPS